MKINGIYYERYDWINASDVPAFRDILIEKRRCSKERSFRTRSFFGFSTIWFSSRRDINKAIKTVFTKCAEKMEIPSEEFIKAAKRWNNPTFKKIDEFFESVDLEHDDIFDDEVEEKIEELDNILAFLKVPDVRMDMFLDTITEEDKEKLRYLLNR